MVTIKSLTTNFGSGAFALLATLLEAAELSQALVKACSYFPVCLGS
nr:hypothetical protein [Lacticaseibacillus thailandensis]